MPGFLASILCPVGFAQGGILRPVVCITTVTVTVSHIQRGHRHSKICHNDVMLQAHTRSGAVAKNDVAANRARRGMQDEQATNPSIIPGYVQLYARRPLQHTHNCGCNHVMNKCTHSGKLLAYFLRTAASSDKHAWWIPFSVGVSSRLTKQVTDSQDLASLACIDTRVNGMPVKMPNESWQW